jgi:3-hydroxyacyl-[acyl-carrier-protein] dehydratase
MILKNSLYTIEGQQSQEGTVSYDIRLHSHHFIYQAHFPGEPITPGVCIIQIAKELLEDVVGERLLIQAVKNVKFLHVISPVEMPHITYVFEKITFDDTMKTTKVVALVNHDDTPLAKLSFTCKQS